MRGESLARSVATFLRSAATLFGCRFGSIGRCSAAWHVCLFLVAFAAASSGAFVSSARAHGLHGPAVVQVPAAKADTTASEPAAEPAQSITNSCAMNCCTMTGCFTIMVTQPQVHLAAMAANIRFEMKHVAWVEPRAEEPLRRPPKASA